jgi:hypothetical protein
MAPFRSRFNIYYTNFNSTESGLGFKFGMDNYEGFYAALDFNFDFASEQIDAYTAIELGYMIYANNISITPNIDLGAKTSFNSNYITQVFNSFYVSPGAMMEYKLTKNIGFFAETSYIFDFPVKNETNTTTLDPENGLKINVGAEFMF